MNTEIYDMRIVSKETFEDNVNSLGPVDLSFDEDSERSSIFVHYNSPEGYVGYTHITEDGVEYFIAEAL